MKKIFIHIIFLLTILSHPVFLPIYLGIWYFFSKSTQIPIVYTYFIPLSLKIKWLLLYASLTTIMPILILFMARIFKMIHSLTLDSVRDRKYFFLIIGVYYWFLFYMLKEFYAREFLRPTIVIIGVISFFMFLASLITGPLFKLSIHAAGFGILTGFFVALTLLYNSYFMPEIHICIFISSVVMLLRLILTAHTFAELLIGWISGLVSSVLIFMIIYNVY